MIGAAGGNARHRDAMEIHQKGSSALTRKVRRGGRPESTSGRPGCSRHLFVWRLTVGRGMPLGWLYSTQHDPVVGRMSSGPNSSNGPENGCHPSSPRAGLQRVGAP